MALDITIEGFPEIDLGQVEQSVRYAAMVSINKTGRWAESSLRKSAYQDVNFPSGYLDSRLNYKETSMSFLEGKVVGRDNPTSLARFASGDSNNITLTVKKGVSQEGKKLFFLKLHNGNIGLAVRVLKGSQITNKTHHAKPLKDNYVRKDGSKVRYGNSKTDVYLLYGPSVDQVMRRNIKDVFKKKLGDELAENFNSNLQLRGL